MGIETLGSVFTKLIERNTTIPTRKGQIFSTAADNQTAVSINVLQGERAMAHDNKSLGRFDLIGIPPAPRGIPQVEVTFDIDANGIVNVNAKDLGTGKEQKITIVAPMKLNEEEVDRMRKEAEQFAAEDEKRKKEVETFNEADSLAYQTEKLLPEFEGKVSQQKIDSIRQKLEALKKELEQKERNAPKVKSDFDALNKAVQEASVELYQKTGKQPGQGNANAQEQAPKDGDRSGDDENVVDADFEEKK